MHLREWLPSGPHWRRTFGQVGEEVHDIARRDERSARELLRDLFGAAGGLRAACVRAACVPRACRVALRIVRRVLPVG